MNRVGKIEQGSERRAENDRRKNKIAEKNRKNRKEQIKKKQNRKEKIPKRNSRKLVLIAGFNLGLSLVLKRS